jgi:hypothetical protein
VAVADETEPTQRERELAVLLVGVPGRCDPPAKFIAAYLANYRAELARDPAFVLGAAEALLRDAACGALRIELDEAYGRAVGAKLDCFWTGQLTANSKGDPSKALPDVYSKLLAARKGAPMAEKVWDCDTCKIVEPVSTAPGEEYDVGDWEPCIHCDGTAYVRLKDAGRALPKVPAARKERGDAG